MIQDSRLLGTDILSQHDRYNFKTLLDSNDIDIGQHNDISDSPYENVNLSCHYYSEEDYIQSFSNNDKFSLMSLNIQGLNAKFSKSFKDFSNMLTLNGANFDLIAIQEVSTIIDINSFNLDNFHDFICKTRKSGKGGGIGFYVSKSVKFRILEDLSIFRENFFESLFIEIELNEQTKIIVGNIYRPQRQDLDDFLSLIQSIIRLSEFSCKSYILGDLNIDLLKFKEHAKTNLFLDSMFSSGFIQLISHPTRVAHTAAGNTATLIDHIWTNNIADSINSGIITSHISDHYPIFHLLNSSKSKAKPKVINTRNFSSENINFFKESLSGQSFNDVLNEEDPQKAYDSFHKTFFDLFEITFPLQVKKFNKNIHKIEPWITKGLLKSRMTKMKLSKISARNPTFENKNKFKAFKNLYNKLSREMKKIYYQDQIIKHQGDAKKSWELIREATGSKKEG